MSVATDLQSVIDAKEVIRQAIIAKGVDVPAEAKLDTYHTYIDQISSAPEGDGTDWGTLYTTAYPDGIILAEADFSTIAQDTSASVSYALHTTRVAKTTITKYTFGKKCTNPSPYFLRCCYKLSEVEFMEVVKEVPDYFLADCPNLKNGIDLTNATKIGEYFLSGSYNYSAPITIPASVREIGGSFISNMVAFVGPLTIETNTVPSNNLSLTALRASDPTYATGIQISGSGAAAWKEALPDSPRDPYRKLILVEE